MHEHLARVFYVHEFEKIFVWVVYAYTFMKGVTCA
jgi:hypothetical protein